LLSRFTLIGQSARVSPSSTTTSLSGRTFDQTFAPSPNQRFDFVWDRQDAYGRTLQGGQPLTGSIDYAYPSDYTKPNTELAFGNAGGAVLLEQSGRSPFIVSQPFSTTIGEGLTDARAVSLGAGPQRPPFLDPVAHVVHYGDAARRQRADSLSRVINTLIQKPADGFGALAVGPDGSIYYPGTRGATVRRFAPDGVR
jgi:hypothetical protein